MQNKLVHLSRQQGSNSEITIKQAYEMIETGLDVLGEVST
jgi:hypothetical protein